MNAWLVMFIFFMAVVNLSVVALKDNVPSKKPLLRRERFDKQTKTKVELDERGEAPDCSQKPASVNFKTVSDVGCAGAKYSNGQDVQAYCTNSIGRTASTYLWYAHCCDWTNKQCKDKARLGVGETPTPTTAPGVNLNFGGSYHGTLAAGQKDRPEMVKSEVCSPTACKDCSSTAGCWHGYKHFEYDGFLYLKVGPDTPLASYIAEVWARCGDGGGAWKLQISELINGILEVFVDGKLTRTIDEDRAVVHNGKYWLDIPISGDARIRVSLRPVNTAKEAKARIIIMANGIVPSVESCMAVKDGLRVLGDGSEDAFELRNVNRRQLTCLQRRFEGMSSTLRQKCIDWMKLLSREQQNTLRVFLSAALVKSDAGMVEVQNRQHLRPSLNGSQSSFPTCVDPSVDDPESWDCECLPTMIQTCSLSKYSELSLENCLRSLMCKNPAVCESWKEDHNECKTDPHWKSAMEQDPMTGGVAPLMRRSSMTVKAYVRANENHSVAHNAEIKQRTQVSTHVANNDGLGDGLDGTMQGKCASQ